ncbi:RNA polymerase subunit sigma-70 [Nocardia neocaledoniensis]|uniref:RNA polymerase subunit sigma-70 n=1 Tax=Nocardia neocaledoniensis TaxID=236511 RepID=UPI0024558586|nr:RNA polymerase subunit sigma-70 [Nocardia neocaledoniensis]
MNSAGDPAAARAEFDRLVAPLRAELHAHCYRFLGSVHDADDAVQETLLRAWRSRHTLADARKLRPWLYKIATNRCLTMIERCGKQELPMDHTETPATERVWLEPYPGAGAGAPGPEARYTAGEAVELAFVALLQQLPGVQRGVLILRDVLGFTANETADLLEVSVASANSALQRARGHIARGTSSPSHDPDDPSTRRLAQRYAAAWEAADVDAIIALFAADARYAMPPRPEWYAGPVAIREFLVTGPLRWRWRFLPTRANGQPAFGTYNWDAERGLFVAMALDVLTVRDGAITEVVSFLDPALFGRFGLPEAVGD